MRRATWYYFVQTCDYVFQSTLSMRRATTVIIHDLRAVPISIHALHEESDSPRTLKRYGSTYISIHALHEESDRLR